MIKLFFLNESIIDITNSEFIDGLLSIIEIQKNSNDEFLKHESIYNCDNYIELCSKYSYDAGEILKYFEQLSPSNIYLYPESIFEKTYSGFIKGYLGVDFTEIKLENKNYVTNQLSYENFRSFILLNSNFRELWDRRDQIFKNLTLCGMVKDQISKIGNSSYYNQIFEKLLLFDNALKDWNQGEFSYKYFNENYPLRISPESEQTLTKFGNERKFSLPNGGTKTFDLHIKTGDLRFHFYPDIQNRKVYIGYIGPHLSTVSN